MTTPATVNMLTVTHTQMDLLLTLEVAQKRTLLILPPPHYPDVSPKISPEATPTPKPLIVHRMEALLTNACRTDTIL